MVLEGGLGIGRNRLDRDETTRRFYAEVWPHAPTVLRVARLLSRDPATAEDWAQETLLKAFRAMERLQPDLDARKWLLTILRNTRTDHLRSAAREVPVVGLDAAGVELAAPEAAEVLSETEEGDPHHLLAAFSDQEVIDALGQVPEEMRWTLLLADVEGLDHTEVAALLDVPVGTVKSRLHRGRAMLRTILWPLAKARRMIRDVDVDLGKECR